MTYTVTTLFNKTVEFDTINEVTEFIFANTDYDNSVIKNVIDEIYEPYKIGGVEYYPSQILPKVDIANWREIASNFIDAEVENLEYDLERADDGDTFSCLGFEIEVSED